MAKSLLCVRTEWRPLEWLVRLLPCVAAVVSYLNGLQGHFVHDDIFAIVNNPDVTGRNPVWRLFQNDFWGTSMTDPRSHKSYRPLCVLSFRFDYFISGGNPVWFHLVNLTLHVLVTLALTLVSRHVLSLSKSDTTLSSLLFAVHPIHTEAVTGIVGRADVLAAIFFLLAFYFYARCVTSFQINTNDPDTLTRGPLVIQMNKPLILLSVLLAAASMLCKETGSTALGVFVLFDVLHNWSYIFQGRSDARTRNLAKRCLTRCVTVTAVAVTLLTLRLWMMNFSQPTVFSQDSNPASFNPHFLTRLQTFLYLPVLNMWLLLCPRCLSYDWTGASVPLITSISDPRNLLSSIFYLLGLYFVIRCFRTTGKMATSKQDRMSCFPLALSAGLMVLPFLPASNLFFRVGFVIAERVLYIPSMGYCLLLVQGFSALCQRVPRFKRLLLALFLGLLVVLMARTLHRNQVWNSRSSLFWSGVRTFPQNAKAHFNLANLLKDEQDLEGAAKHYQTAVNLNPDVASYHLNLGTVLANKTQAGLCYQQALRLQPHHPGALVNLGNLLLDSGNFSGEALVRQALAIDPNHYEGLLAMITTLLNKKNFSEAQLYISHALASRPDSAQFHLCHAIYLHSTGQSSAALAEYQATLRLDPLSTEARFSLAKFHFSLGHLTEAEDQLKWSVHLKPDCWDCWSLLGSVYSRQGRKKDAVITLGHATTLAPNNTNIMLKYIQLLLETGKKNKAVQILQGLLAKNSNDVTLLSFAFTFSMQEGNYGQALAYIGAAIKVAEQTRDSILSSLYQKQGQAYRFENDYSRAVESYEKAIKLNSTLVEAMSDLGTIYFLQKNYTQAENYYLRVLAIDQNNKLTRQNLEKLRQVLTKASNDKR